MSALELNEKPLVEVFGGRGGVSRDSVREVWQFREVLTACAVRMVKVKYKQAAIGIGWAVLQPVAAALVFTVFLGRLTHIESEGLPYLVFALSGMVAWSFFSSAASSSMESVVADAVILRKVYFPREIFPIAAVMAALVDLVPALGVLIVAALAYGITPTLAWIALPLSLSLLVTSVLALGLALSAMNVYYRDVRYVVPFVLQLSLFATPVVYSLSAVPGRWRTAYELFNPVAAAIDGIRREILHGTWPALGVTLGALTWSPVLCVGAFVLFKHLERGFSDRI
jgi:lipopolysaccharide transport system permease protein